MRDRNTPHGEGETIFSLEYNLEEVTQDLALLTTQEAKDHVRIDTTVEDDYVDALIQEATDLAQRHTNRQLLTATYKRHLPRFPGRTDLPIYLPKPPLDSVTSIKYVDVDGITQTWNSSKWQVDGSKEPARIMPEPDQSYPDVQDDRFQAVTIEYKAGYGSSDNVPALIKAAVKQIVAYLYDNRQGVTVGVGYGQQIGLPDSALRSLDRYRVMMPR